MDAILASLSAGLVLGVGDFYGGLASKSSRVVIVGLLGQALGLMVVAGLVLLAHIPFFKPAFLCGAAAGVFGGTSLLALYKGLAVGRVSLVAPLSALLGALVPVLYSLISGQSLTLSAWLAIGLGLVAVYLLSLPGTNESEKQRTAGLFYAVTCGLCLGGFYIMLGHPDVHGSPWTLVSERLTIVTMLSLIMVLQRVPIAQADRQALKLAALAGVCDILGNLLYLFSAARGPLHMVALLTSLYPASTLLLGWLVLKEPLNKRIALGAGCALGSIALFGWP